MGDDSIDMEDDLKIDSIDMGDDIIDREMTVSIWDILSLCAPPYRGKVDVRAAVQERDGHLGVAAQVEFESKV